MTYTFHIVVERDADEWRAYCPAFENYRASTGGETREAALTSRSSSPALLSWGGGAIPMEGKPTIPPSRRQHQRRNCKMRG
jgi:hypothetical protein